MSLRKTARMRPGKRNVKHTKRTDKNPISSWVRGAGSTKVVSFSINLPKYIYIYGRPYAKYDIYIYIIYLIFEIYALCF